MSSRTVVVEDCYLYFVHRLKHYEALYTSTYTSFITSFLRPLVSVRNMRIPSRLWFWEKASSDPLIETVDAHAGYDLSCAMHKWMPFHSGA
ncbi:hypothetical protein HDU90_004167 [Geranomyces variabilis]|nr:hypothetical protein HDU90_004167 [Geranomyces variabilis]